MPVKDLVGRPRLSVEEQASRKEMLAMIEQFHKRRGAPDDSDLSPVTPPSGPSPTPLAGAAEFDVDR
ncbi:hypothetical protein [uncultured Sphingomonas sp.]|uniref:hypothetical protein n=1 Tax=uncultured Sphingomonas sp. TaxID=158754 RepID=UPI0035CA8AFD